MANYQFKCKKYKYHTSIIQILKQCNTVCITSLTFFIPHKESSHA